MLSYIDIEAFATANNRANTKPSAVTQENFALNLTSPHLSIRRKQIAKRLVAASKHQDKPAKPA